MGQNKLSTESSTTLDESKDISNAQLAEMFRNMQKQMLTEDIVKDIVKTEIDTVRRDMLTESTVKDIVKTEIKTEIKTVKKDIKKIVKKQMLSVEQQLKENKVEISKVQSEARARYYDMQNLAIAANNDLSMPGEVSTAEMVGRSPIKRINSFHTFSN